MESEEEARPPARRSWTLTPEAFDGLLAALDPDRDRAAAAYERLRERVIGLLRWWGASQPEELADESLDRVARKLHGGAEVPNASLGAYVRGVARMVFHEWTRRPRPEHAAIEVAAMVGGRDDEAALTDLDRCLSTLDADDRRLLLGYYADGRASDIRRKLADDMGLSPTALRIRAHRLRVRIEASLKHSAPCAHSCQGERKGESA